MKSALISMFSPAHEIAAKSAKSASERTAAE
jgi:hypothetical protein